MKSSSSRAAGKPWAKATSFPTAGAGGTVALFLSTPAPSGTGGIPHFPAEQRRSWKRTGTSVAGGGGPVCKERAVLGAAEQVPGAGHPGWQRCPAAAAMLWAGAFLPWPAMWVGTRNLQPEHVATAVATWTEPLPTGLLCDGKPGGESPRAEYMSGKGGAPLVNE